MKLLLLAIEQHVTAAALLPPASAGSRTRVQQALDVSFHQPWPWSDLGVTLVNLLGNLGVMRSKTGRVTGTLLQVLKFCPYFQHLNLLKMHLSQFLGVVRFQQFLKASDQCKVSTVVEKFQQLWKCCVWIRRIRLALMKRQIQPECGDGQADAGRDCRTRLARSNSQARTGTGKNAFSLFS